MCKQTDITAAVSAPLQRARNTKSANVDLCWHWLELMPENAGELMRRTFGSTATSLCFCGYGLEWLSFLGGEPSSIGTLPIAVYDVTK